MIEQTILQGLSEFDNALSGKQSAGAHDLQQRIEALTRDERTELHGALSKAIATHENSQEVNASVNAALETMGRIEIARDWMRLYLEKHDSSAAWGEATRKTSKSASASITEYVCPRGDYRWQQPSVAKPVPLCPIHNVALNAVA